MVNTYFGQVTGNYLESCLEDGSAMFQNSAGDYFDFKLSVNEDQVIIQDASGRHLPLGHAAALELLKALKYVKPMCKVYADHEELSYQQDGEYSVYAAGV